MHADGSRPASRWGRPPLLANPQAPREEAGSGKWAPRLRQPCRGDRRQTSRWVCQPAPQSPCRKRRTRRSDLAAQIESGPTRLLSPDKTVGLADHHRGQAARHSRAEGARWLVRKQRQQPSGGSTGQRNRPLGCIQERRVAAVTATMAPVTSSSWKRRLPRRGR